MEIPRTSSARAGRNQLGLSAPEPRGEERGGIISTGFGQFSGFELPPFSPTPPSVFRAGI